MIVCFTPNGILQIVKRLNHTLTCPPPPYPLPPENNDDKPTKETHTQVDLKEE